MNPIVYWITRGPVRGQCGHKHRTEAGAHRCRHADARACRSVRGYSDRWTMAVHKNGDVTGPYLEME
jgi:hypothetical protein